MSPSPDDKRAVALSDGSVRESPSEDEAVPKAPRSLLSVFAPFPFVVSDSDVEKERPSPNPAIPKRAGAELNAPQSEYLRALSVDF